MLVVRQVSSRRERQDTAEQLRTAAADLRSDCNVMALLAGPPVSSTVATYCDRHAELMELLVTSLGVR